MISEMIDTEPGQQSAAELEESQSTLSNDTQNIILLEEHQEDTNAPEDEGSNEAGQTFTRTTTMQIQNRMV